MTTLPSLVCPVCGASLEYHVTVEMLNPPIGKIDTGYCRACAALLERIRETGTYYDSTLWQPVCLVCRQPVTFVGLSPGDAHIAVYRCREHSQEQWTWNVTAARWARLDVER